MTTLDSVSLEIKKLLDVAIADERIKNRRTTVKLEMLMYLMPYLLGYKLTTEATLNMFVYELKQQIKLDDPKFEGVLGVLDVIAVMVKSKANENETH